MQCSKENNAVQSKIKRAILTGPTGAVGCALARELSERGVMVYAVCRPGSKRIRNLPQNEFVRVLECELSDLSSLKEILSNKIDAFFHLGWADTFGDGRNNMDSQIDNIRFTMDAVELAHSTGCDVFVGAGSQAEFGRVSGKLSGSLPAFPENGYGMAKLCAGQMSRVKCAQYGIRHIWARILSVYGPFDGDYTMVMATIRKLLAGEKPSFTAGEQQWDYLYSEDAGRMLAALAERGKSGTIYCLGSGETRPLSEYITVIRDTASPGAPLGLGEIPYSEGQVMYLCADTSDLAKDTGCRAQVSFEEGISRTVDWYKKRLNSKQHH